MTDLLMVSVDEPDDIYTALTDCMVRGAHVELKLRGGETVARFRAHDIIAPRGFQGECQKFCV